VQLDAIRVNKRKPAEFVGFSPAKPTNPGQRITIRAVEILVEIAADQFQQKAFFHTRAISFFRHVPRKVLKIQLINVITGA